MSSIPSYSNYSSSPNSVRAWQINSIGCPIPRGTMGGDFNEINHLIISLEKRYDYNEHCRLLDTILGCIEYYRVNSKNSWETNFHNSLTALYALVEKQEALPKKITLHTNCHIDANYNPTVDVPVWCEKLPIQLPTRKLPIRQTPVSVSPTPGLSSRQFSHPNNSSFVNVNLSNQFQSSMYHYHNSSTSISSSSATSSSLSRPPQPNIPVQQQNQSNQFRSSSSSSSSLANAINVAAPTNFSNASLLRFKERPEEKKSSSSTSSSSSVRSMIKGNERPDNFVIPERELAEAISSEILDRDEMSFHRRPFNEMYHILLEGKNKLKGAYAAKSLFATASLLNTGYMSSSDEPLNLLHFKLAVPFRRYKADGGFFTNFERSSGCNERYAIGLGKNGVDGLMPANYVTKDIILSESPHDAHSEPGTAKALFYQMLIEQNVQIHLSVAAAVDTDGKPQKYFDFLTPGESIPVTAFNRLLNRSESYTVTCDERQEKLPSKSPNEFIFIRTITIQEQSTRNTKTLYQLLPNYIAAGSGGFKNTQFTIQFLKSFLKSKGIIFSAEHPIVINCKTGIDRSATCAALLILDNLIQKKRQLLISSEKKPTFENVFGRDFSYVQELRLIALAIANRSQGTACTNAMHETYLCGFFDDWDSNNNKFGKPREQRMGSNGKLDYVNRMTDPVKAFTDQIEPTDDEIGSLIRQGCSMIDNCFRNIFDSLYNQNKKVLELPLLLSRWDTSSSSSSSSSSSTRN